MTTTIRRAIALLCALVALLSGAAAGLGIFARGDGTYVTVTSALGESYEMAANGVYAGSGRQLVAEGVGWDVFTLVVAVPILLVAAALLARGSFRGSLVAAGMLGYFFYMYLEYAVTWAFGPLFGLFIATYGLSLVALIGVVALINRDGITGRFDHRFPRRSWAALSVGMAVLLGGMWVGRVVAGLAAEVPELHGETTMTVQALDLGLVVPVAIIVAVLAIRRVPAGLAAAAAFAVTFATLTAAIGAMMVSAWIVTGISQLPPLVLFGLASGGGVLVAVRMYRSVPSGSHHPPAHATHATRTADLPVAG